MQQNFFASVHLDHVRIDGVLAELDGLKSDERERYLSRLKTEIIPHVHGEETGLYPLLQWYDESRDAAQKGVSEHRKIQDGLKLQACSPVTFEQWVDAFRQLRVEIRRHIQYEEDTIFNLARTVLKDHEMRDVADRFRSEKERMKRTASGTPAG